MVSSTPPSTLPPIFHDLVRTRLASARDEASLDAQVRELHGMLPREHRPSLWRMIVEEVERLTPWMREKIASEQPEVLPLAWHHASLDEAARTGMIAVLWRATEEAFARDRDTQHLDAIGRLVLEEGVSFEPAWQERLKEVAARPRGGAAQVPAMDLLLRARVVDETWLLERLRVLPAHDARRFLIAASEETPPAVLRELLQQSPDYSTATTLAENAAARRDPECFRALLSLRQMVGEAVLPRLAEAASPETLPRILEAALEQGGWVVKQVLNRAPRESLSEIPNESLARLLQDADAEVRLQALVLSGARSAVVQEIPGHSPASRAQGEEDREGFRPAR